MCQKHIITCAELPDSRPSRPLNEQSTLKSEVAMVSCRKVAIMIKYLILFSVLDKRLHIFNYDKTLKILLSDKYFGTNMIGVMVDFFFP